MPKPRIVAIVRVLYGSDFAAESVASVYDHVDAVLCVISRRVFGGSTAVRYFGHEVVFPHDFDGVEIALRRFKAEHDHAGKVTIIDNPFDAELVGQMRHITNQLVIPRYPGATHVLLLEPDEVYHEDVIGRLVEMAADERIDEWMVSPHLFWRTWRCASTRDNPYVVLRAIKGRTDIGPTSHALLSLEKGVRRVDTGLRFHNFGYAASARTVFWKHLASLSFSRDLNLDSPPREEWFEEVWQPWNMVINPRPDLCPSKGYETAFPAVRPYPFEELPDSMQRRILERPLVEWVEHDRLAGLAPPAPVHAGAPAERTVTC
ncbi:MAG: hypothetical protein AB7K52_03130 [Phycisphaerales bacterium]